MTYKGVEGLYLYYKTLDVTFEDVRTLTNIEGKDINGEDVDFINDTLPSVSKAGGVLTAADTVAKNTPEDENNFFVNVVRAEVYQEIMGAIQDLPTECGRIFKLAYVEGFSNDEIATQLSISVNTVKAQKNKAKIQLREKLKGLYPVLLFFV